MERGRLTLIAFALSAALVACGGDPPGGGHEEHAETAAGSVPGEAADASEATREVEIVALDDPRFNPASIKVSAGDVITFVITNEGKSDHEFVLGDSAYQETHGDAEHDMASENVVEVPPGQTEELTWRFDESGSVLYGCHIDGHYNAGMVGTIEVR